MLMGPNSKFPYGLGLVPKLPRTVTKKKRNRLGCSSCGPRRMSGLRGLGQEGDDIDTLLTDPLAYGENPDNLPTPGVSPVTGSSSSWDSTAASPTGIIPVFNNPSVSPISPTQGIATTFAAATSTSPSPLLTYNAAGVPVAASSVSSMLPWLALGLGGIALLAVMGKRR
jgi:hypothetical protein